MTARQENATLRAVAAQWLRYERHCILIACERVPCTWLGIPDVFAMTARRTVIEIEIKRTMADFRANSRKRCIVHRDGRHDITPEQFYFLAPRSLAPSLVDLMPKGYGLLMPSSRVSRFTGLPLLVCLRPAMKQNPSKVLTMREIVRLLKAQSGTLVSALAKVSKQ